MLSSTIAQAGSKARLRYHHGCSNHVNMETATIQQLLPPDLTLGTGVGQFPLAESCTKCLGKLDNTASQYTNDLFVECMGIPPAGVATESVDPMTFSLRVASFRHNVQQAVQDFRKLELESGIPAPVYGGAVILLDLEDSSRANGDASQAWALPLYHYTEIIPKDISSIAILAPQQCMVKPWHNP